MREKVLRLWDEIEGELAGMPAPLSSDDLRGVLAFLDGLSLPPPPEGGEDTILPYLKSQVPASRFRHVLETLRPSLARRALGLLAAVRPQAHILGRSFWMATAAVSLGLLPLMAWVTGDGTAVLVMLAPLLAVAGVGFAFRGTPSGLWEVEQASPLDPMALALARFLVMVSYDVLLLSVVTSVTGFAGRAALALAWLAPLVFLGTVALLAALRWGGGAGVLVGMSLWALLVGWRHMAAALEVSSWSSIAGFDPFALPGDPLWLANKVALLIMTAALSMGAILGPRLRRWLIAPKEVRL